MKKKPGPERPDEEYRWVQQWREPRRRPALEIAIGPAERSWWTQFAPYHYLSASLHGLSKCFLLWVGDEPAAFTAVINQSLRKNRPPSRRIHRVVTLPDWQGLGLGFVLIDTVAAAYRAAGVGMRLVTGNWIFARKLRSSPHWRQSKNARLRSRRTLASVKFGWFGGRCVASFEYIGPPDMRAAVHLLRRAQDQEREE